MLTPTDVHFLVGILTQISRPDGVEVELGSLVFDDVADEDRDVDITVKVTQPDGTMSAYSGIEVKHHKRPLDVTHVEQLCAKLRDMPDLTACGIVSTSGYTKPAVKKADHYGVKLYSLIDWMGTIELGGVTLPDNLTFTEHGFAWLGEKQVLLSTVPDPPANATDYFNSTALLSKAGVVLHETVQTFAGLMALRAPQLALQQGVPQEAIVAATAAQGCEVLLPDESYFIVDGEKYTVVKATVTGELKYVAKSRQPILKKLVSYHDQQPLVACAIFEMQGNNLGGISIDPSRKMRWLSIPVADRLLKKIYRRGISRL